jgi:hypothetical protein
VKFQNYIPKPYQQVGSRDTFVPYLSVLDALMNVGHEKTAELIRHGTDHWDSWDGMMQVGADATDGFEEDGHGN